MSKIVLKQLTLVNFKGVRELTVDFSRSATVCGANGTGKTTLVDAFHWLLFGKDSSGRGDRNNGFNVKTLDATGKPIYRLEHSVTGVLEIEGRGEVKLQRKLVEKWNKINGSTQEVMKDETHFLINDVRCGTQKEYQAEISDIIPEDTFRMITNPYWFTSLSAESQKEILLDMVGNISDEDVAKTNEAYQELLAGIAGTTLIKFAKEVSMKKRSLNDELAVIPSNIETCNKLMSDPEDCDALEAELKQKRAKLSELETQIADKTAINEKEIQRKEGIQRVIGDKRVTLANLEAQIRANATADYNKAMLAVERKQSTLAMHQRDLENKRNDIDRLEGEINSLTLECDALRENYTAVFYQQFTEPDTTDPKSFCCPTCHQKLPASDIAAQVEAMRGNFNQDKASKLKSIQEKGIAKKQQIEDRKKQIQALQALVESLDDKILALKGETQIAKDNLPKSYQDADELINASEERKALLNEIAQLQNELTVEAKPVDVSDLQEGRSLLNQAIEELIKRLERCAKNKKIAKEIKDLEERQIACNQAVADLERWENTYASFQKDKDRILMERINGMFQVVTFSFVKEQKNGGEKITCFCSVNGVPYADVNYAGKLNAGLDIINAMCKAKGISAPIFVDNRESVNQIIPTISQVINLCVTTDETLKIK